MRRVRSKGKFRVRARSQLLNDPDGERQDPIAYHLLLVPGVDVDRNGIGGRVDIGKSNLNG